MIVHIQPDGTLALLRTEDLGRFHVEVDASADRLEAIRPAIAGTVDFEGPEVAWVTLAYLHDQPAFASSPDRARLDAMVAKAAPHGWVNTAGTALRAHVVWQPSG